MKNAHKQGKVKILKRDGCKYQAFFQPNTSPAFVYLQPKNMSMDFQSVIEQLHKECYPLVNKGKVADYIPALANVKPEQLGICVSTLNGKHYEVGDCHKLFSIQSISKVFSFTLAFKALGNEVWKRVGKEPSGNAFNSLVQLEYEHGIPRNPFINAGALVIVDMILSSYTYPYRSLLDFVREITGNPAISYNEEVAQSEKEHGHRNAALAHFMKSYLNIHNPVEDVLDFYFRQCALEMNCVDLSRAFLYLANHGVIPQTDNRILTQSQTKRTNALMLTTGMYNESGEFAFRVGLPGKSGVGGGIAAIIPQNLSIAVWSPGLNNFGNSLAGVEVLERFTTETGLSVF